MFIMWTRGEDKFLPQWERSSFEISKSFLEGGEQVLKVSLHAKQGACSRLWPILENEGVASLQKDIPPLSDRPIRWLPMWWGKNQRRYRIVPRGKNERERETFKAFRGMTRKSYYRKRILPFVFGEWFAPLFRIFIGCDRSFLWKFLNFYRIDTEFLFLYI